MKTGAFAAVLLAAALAACSTSRMAPDGPGESAATEAGEAYVDAEGMTLYTFDEDGEGVSTCTGLCAEAWPPVLAEAAPREDDGRFTAIVRPNGDLQWALDGKPLYTYAFDEEPGDATGDGVDGTWHIARPDA
jgi:predicted lipoprotein with Yx(FWY)xxD motif